MRDEAVGLRLIKRGRLLVHGDVQHGHAIRIATAIRVPIHDAGIHLWCSGDAVGTPHGEPFEKHDAPGEVRKPNRGAGGRDGAVGSGELASGDEGEVGDSIAHAIRGGAGKLAALSEGQGQQ